MMCRAHGRRTNTSDRGIFHLVEVSRKGNDSSGMMSAGRESAQGGRREAGESHVVLGSGNVQATDAGGTSHHWVAGAGVASGMVFP